MFTFSIPLYLSFCLPFFIQAIDGATLAPVRTSSNKLPELWYTTGTTTPPSKYEDPWYIAMNVSNRTFPAIYISGQAVLGTITQAMYNVSQFPLDASIRNYTFTLNHTERPQAPFITTFDIKVTPEGKGGHFPPYDLTNGRLLHALSLLGAVYAAQRDFERLVEWAFDLWVMDRLHPERGRVIAKGIIAHPPIPMVGQQHVVSTA
ncbi:MAG: hypothetical protein Q9178_004575 [Gyalolechia marmorata]